MENSVNELLALLEKALLIGAGVLVTLLVGWIKKVIKKKEG